MKKHIKVVIKVLVSTFLLFILLRTVDISIFLKNIQYFHYIYIPIILMLLVANYVISSIRWKMLLVWQEYANISVLYLTKLYFIGSFFNNFMPTSIGGDVYKIYRLGKKIQNNSRAFSATFMERFTGVVSLVLISLFAGIKLYSWLGLGVFILFWVALYVGFKLFNNVASRISKLQNIKIAFGEYTSHKNTLLQALVLSFIVQIIAIFTQYFVFLALGQSVSILYTFLFLPFITLASFVIPSLNGIGVQDSLYISLFSFAGISSEAALSISVMYHLFRLAISLVGGVWYAVDKD